MADNNKVHTQQIDHNERKKGKSVKLSNPNHYMHDEQQAQQAQEHYVSNMDNVTRKVTFQPRQNLDLECV